MADIYIFRPTDEDLDTAGICGALCPKECLVTLGASAPTLTLTHPRDKHGKWDAIAEGRVLAVQIPVRSTPEIQGGAVVGVYEVYTINRTATKSQRYMYSKRDGGKKLKLLPPDTPVSVVSKEDKRWKIKTAKYGTGWIDPDGVSYSETVDVMADDGTLPSWSIRTQYFDITGVKIQNGEKVVTARHILYRLLKNNTTYINKAAATLPTVAQAIMDSCDVPHDFSVHTDIGDSKTGMSWIDVNPIKAFFDEETGAAVRWGAQPVFDNWDLYLLRKAGRNRGVRIEYGKNLIEAEWEVNTDNVYTRIKPRGEKSDGSPMYLPEKYVDSPRISNYPEPMIYPLECKDAKVGKEVTEALALDRMREQAQELLTTGIDMPTVSIHAEFLQPGRAGETASELDVEMLYPYDTVTLYHPDVGEDVEQTVSGGEWDAIADRWASLDIGFDDGQIITRLASWQMPSNISGGKIAYGTLGSGALADDVISARHVQADSINAEALQAESVTAKSIAAGAVDAAAITAITAKFAEIASGSITTDALYASLADIVTLMVGDITADSITTDQLAAVLGDFVKLYADIAGIDFAAVRDLDADEAIFRVGTALELYVDRLAVTSANIVSAMLGDLVLRGSDGKYYRVVIGADGTITTEETTVTDGEIASGSTSGGQAIVGTNINVGSLNAQSINAASATIAEIFTSALTAGKITAGQALIASVTSPELYTTAIKSIGDNLELTANKSIQFLIATNDLVRAYFAFTEDGIRTQRPGSAYATLVNDVGFHIIQQSEIIASFAKRRLEVESVAVGPVSSPQPRMILTHAQDGGLLITREDWI